MSDEQLKPALEPKENLPLLDARYVAGLGDYVNKVYAARESLHFPVRLLGVSTALRQVGGLDVVQNYDMAVQISSGITKTKSVNTVEMPSAEKKRMEHGYNEFGLVAVGGVFFDYERAVSEGDRKYRTVLTSSHTPIALVNEIMGKYPILPAVARAKAGFSQLGLKDIVEYFSGQGSSVAEFPFGTIQYDAVQLRKLPASNWKHFDTMDPQQMIQLSKVLEEFRKRYFADEFNVGKLKQYLNSRDIDLDLEDVDILQRVGTIFHEYQTQVLTDNKGKPRSTFDIPLFGSVLGGVMLWRDTVVGEHIREAKRLKKPTSEVPPKSAGHIARSVANMIVKTTSNQV